MNNFPRKGLEASVYLLRDGDFYSAYLKINDLIFNLTSLDDMDRVGYIPGEAKRVEFRELPELVQEVFGATLSSFGLSDRAYGLEKLPEFIEVNGINGFTIFRKRQKMRMNNYKVVHGEKEVWKGNSVEAANSFIESYIQNS